MKISFLKTNEKKPTMCNVFHHIVLKRLDPTDIEGIPDYKTRSYYYPTDMYTAREAVADAEKTERLPGEIVIHAGLEIT